MLKYHEAKLTKRNARIKKENNNVSIYVKIIIPSFSSKQERISQPPFATIDLSHIYQIYLPALSLQSKTLIRLTQMRLCYLSTTHTKNHVLLSTYPDDEKFPKVTSSVLT